DREVWQQSRERSSMCGGAGSKKRRGQDLRHLCNSRHYSTFFNFPGAQPLFRSGSHLAEKVVPSQTVTDCAEPASVDVTDAQAFVQPNGHHYLRTEVYLNGYRVAACCGATSA